MGRAPFRSFFFFCLSMSFPVIILCIYLLFPLSVSSFLLSVFCFFFLIMSSLSSLIPSSRKLTSTPLDRNWTLQSFLGSRNALTPTEQNDCKFRHVVFDAAFMAIMIWTVCLNATIFTALHSQQQINMWLHWVDLQQWKTPQVENYIYRRGEEHRFGILPTDIILTNAQLSPVN